MARLAPGICLKDTYRILRLLGAGGMGEVYEAEHTRLSGRYAVKLLLPAATEDPAAFRRFKREAEIASSLRHPNIVQVIDFDEMTDGTAYLVMEMLEGRDLERELSEHKRIEPQRIESIVLQTAMGLAAAHDRGIVHRDLKPANVFLVSLPGSKQELTKIVDFGISKILDANTKLTADATIMGTPQYMAPEQATGQLRDIGPWTDQFALGSMVREMLAGMPAFSGSTLASILYKVVHETPPRFAELGLAIPESVERVIDRAMSKSPSDRYPSILEFAEALQWAIDQWLLGATLAAPLAASNIDANTVSASNQNGTTFDATTSGSTHTGRAGEASGSKSNRRFYGKRSLLGVGSGIVLTCVAGLVVVRGSRSGAPAEGPSPAALATSAEGTSPAVLATPAVAPTLRSSSATDVVATATSPSFERNALASVTNENHAETSSARRTAPTPEPKDSAPERTSLATAGAGTTPANASSGNVRTRTQRTRLAAPKPSPARPTNGVFENPYGSTDP